MGHDRSLVRHAFEDDNSEIDTHEDISHGINKNRPRKELKEKEEDGETKVQVWIKKETLEYQKRLTLLQIELLKLQNHVKDKGLKVLIIFEGRDAAGKGGTIKRFVEGLDPRGYDVIPVSAPNDQEKSHHYLWRFWKEFPKGGHIGIYDRSWYGRLLVEKAENFCTHEAYLRAFDEINQMEKSWTFDNSIVIKFFITISKDEQLLRFKDREQNKPWKITEEDWRNREKWDIYQELSSFMVEKTSKPHAPWIIVPNNNKLFGRLEVLKSIINILEEKL